MTLIHSQQDIDLDHYDMKEEEPVDGKKSEDDGIEKENLAVLEKIRKNQRQDHLNVSTYWGFVCLYSVLMTVMSNIVLAVTITWKWHKEYKMVNVPASWPNCVPHCCVLIKWFINPMVSGYLSNQEPFG